VNSATARSALRMPQGEAVDAVQLIGRIAQGDQIALADLYALYGPPLFRYLVQLVDDRGLAEEVLQDTLVAVWQSAARFEARSTPRTWLYGIARRQAHNRTRRKALPRADVSELDLTPAGDTEPEEAVLASVEREELAHAIDQLTAAHREILALIFDSGLSYAEAAILLNVPEGTVKSRLNNAKRALRDSLRAEEG